MRMQTLLAVLGSVALPAPASLPVATMIAASNPPAFISDPCVLCKPPAIHRLSSSATPCRWVAQRGSMSTSMQGAFRLFRCLVLFGCSAAGCFSVVPLLGAFRLFRCWMLFGCSAVVGGRPLHPVQLHSTAGSRSGGAHRTKKAGLLEERDGNGTSCLPSRTPLVTILPFILAARTLQTSLTLQPWRPGSHTRQKRMQQPAESGRCASRGMRPWTLWIPPHKSWRHARYRAAVEPGLCFRARSSTKTRWNCSVAWCLSMHSHAPLSAAALACLHNHLL